MTAPLQPVPQKTDETRVVELLTRTAMPDDIERWEWEGGAVAVEAIGASSVRDERSVGGRPTPATQGAFELDDLESATAVRHSYNTPPATGSLWPAPTTR